jgi:hypothetical protein
MAKTEKRVFIPNPHNGKHGIACWIWTRSRGLHVHYRDGSTNKSQYTLRELLNAKEGSGAGFPVEEIKT